jgi:hypothetical protein
MKLNFSGASDPSQQVALLNGNSSNAANGTNKYDVRIRIFTALNFTKIQYVPLCH